MTGRSEKKHCPVPIGTTVQSKPECLSRKNGLRTTRNLWL